VDDALILSTVMNHFDKLYCPESFAKIVNDEYKRFLAIKCVEVIASCKNLEDTTSIYLASIGPTSQTRRTLLARALSQY
jgi:hypothetical protein